MDIWDKGVEIPRKFYGKVKFVKRFVEIGTGLAFTRMFKTEREDRKFFEIGIEKARKEIIEAMKFKREESKRDGMQGVYEQKRV